MTIEGVDIYTDGSCHTQQRIGTWVAIILIGDNKKILSGIEYDTTHNRMEVLAAIKAVEYIKNYANPISSATIYTDSQYVAGLLARKEKIVAAGFTSGKGNLLQNADLVSLFYAITSTFPVAFVKVKAHQKNGEEINYNREADIISRKLLRGIVSEAKDVIASEAKDVIASEAKQESNEPRRPFLPTYH